jgi:hypothetical protein
MKVDLENKAELRKKRSELLRLVSVIDFALGLTQGVSAESSGESDLPPLLAGLNGQLPEQFSSSEVYDLVGADQRQNAKLALRSAVLDGALEIIEEGRGRRATVYRKKA